MKNFFPCTVLLILNSAVGSATEYFLKTDILQKFERSFYFEKRLSFSRKCKINTVENPVKLCDSIIITFDLPISNQNNDKYPDIYGREQRVLLIQNLNPNFPLSSITSLSF